MIPQADLVQPPRLAVWLVTLFAAAEQAEATLGDLLEEFFELTAKSGVGCARSWYWRQSVRTIAQFAWTGFANAPWSTAAAVLGGFLLANLAFRLPERAIFAVLDRYQVYDHHFGVYKFWISDGIVIGLVLLQHDRGQHRWRGGQRQGDDGDHCAGFRQGRIGRNRRLDDVLPLSTQLDLVADAASAGVRDCDGGWWGDCADAEIGGDGPAIGGIAAGESSAEPGDTLAQDMLRHAFRVGMGLVALGCLAVWTQKRDIPPTSEGSPPALQNIAAGALNNGSTIQYDGRKWTLVKQTKLTLEPDATPSNVVLFKIPGADGRRRNRPTLE